MSKVAEAIGAVALMALLYLLMALYVIATNLSAVPSVIALIFDKAFDFQAAAGGFIGAAMAQAMMLGIERGWFSNEAGMGSCAECGGRGLM